MSNVNRYSQPELVVTQLIYSSEYLFGLQGQCTLNFQFTPEM